MQVASFPSFPDKRIVSQNGGTAPKWRSDGKELFFIGATIGGGDLDFSSDGRQMMAAEVKAGSKIETGIPKPLFSIVAFGFLPSIGTLAPLYNVTGDGRKFLLNEMISAARSRSALC